MLHAEALHVNYYILRFDENVGQQLSQPVYIPHKDAFEKTKPTNPQSIVTVCASKSLHWRSYSTFPALNSCKTQTVQAF